MFPVGVLASIRPAGRSEAMVAEPKSGVGGAGGISSGAREERGRVVCLLWNASPGCSGASTSYKVVILVTRHWRVWSGRERNMLECWLAFVLRTSCRVSAREDRSKSKQ